MHHREIEINGKYGREGKRRRGQMKNFEKTSKKENIFITNGGGKFLNKKG